MDKIQNQINQIQQEKVKLDRKLKELIDKRNSSILKVLNTASPANLDPHVLIGGILHVIDQMNQPGDHMEGWRQAGLKFCRKSSSQKSSQAPQKDSQHVAKS